MKRLLILAAIMAGATQSQAMSVDACNIYTTTATGVLKMRQEGHPKRDIVKLFQSQGIYSDVTELAVARAFNADAEVEPEDFRASTFKRCRANEL